jgi:hypothetical protein
MLSAWIPVSHKTCPVAPPRKTKLSCNWFHNTTSEDVSFIRGMHFSHQSSHILCGRHFSLLLETTRMEIVEIVRAKPLHRFVNQASGETVIWIRRRCSIVDFSRIPPVEETVTGTLGNPTTPVSSTRDIRSGSHTTRSEARRDSSQASKLLAKFCVSFLPSRDTRRPRGIRTIVRGILNMRRCT